MVVKEQHKDQHDAFSSCESQFKDNLVKLVDSYQIWFKEPKHLPLKWEIQHEIQLLFAAPNPNVKMYRMSIIENEEINKQIQGLVEKGFTRPNSSPCGSPIILVPK